MEFLVYSDIHHDDYNNGITLEDTINIENEITQYAIENNIKYILFAGDWYRSTNPKQYVIKAAESTWKFRSDAGIYTIVLVGNHDRETKSETSRHAFAAANIFTHDLEHVLVYDSIVLSTIQNIDFLFIPAGWQHKDLPLNNRSPVVIMHGMINGSMRANGSLSGGIDASAINALNPILVLAGDNHTPQKLPMFNCEALYLGAPLQHNWGDRNQDRGFWHIKIDKLVFVQQIITNAPKFIREIVQGNNEVEIICNITSLLSSKLKGCPGIIDITLIGKNVSSLNLKLISESIKLNFNCRNIKFNINQAYNKLDIVNKISNISKPEDKWDTYITSGNIPGIDTMDVSLLSKIGKQALSEARNEI